jgi:hypothetical protein
LTGVPRSGTTLACALLNRLPDTVALHEAMDLGQVVRARTDRARCREIADFFHRTRRSIRRQGVAVSMQADGQVPDNPWDSAETPGGERRLRVTRGEIAIDKPFSEGGLLVLKHPAAFTALVGLLANHFRTYAVIRNPLAVLGSWTSVPFEVRYGRSPMAENFAPQLRQRLERLDSIETRQLCLLSWFFEQYAQHLPVEAILRYEQIIVSGGRALEVIQPTAAVLGEPLENRNASSEYERHSLVQLGEMLLKSEGAYWEFYTRQDVADLLQQVGQ